ncbi:MAG TPA: hypothetical protein VND99_00110 [Candidatus Acidoferrales bacterium]|nr:hypothetical protein [Candidatus Acidoferrales bacterium]
MAEVFITIFNWFTKPDVNFWTMIIGIFTAALWITAKHQLKALSKTSRADFIHRFKNDFFTHATRQIIKLIDQNKLKFDSKTGDFNNDISSYDVDDLILGHFEDLGIFEKKGYIDIEEIYELFDYYIENTWENSAIQEYLEKLSNGSDIYDNFKYLYYKCKSYGEAKMNREFIFLWRIKWKLKEFCL